MKSVLHHHPRTFLLFLLSVHMAHAAPEATPKGRISAVFWNLENFFDYSSEGPESYDYEFTPEGSRKWTSGRFWTKCNGIAKTLFWIGSEYGGMPDVVGVAEVENRKVMSSLLYGTLLRKYGYVLVHRDSPDRRGIDVALCYRKDRFRRISDRGIRIDKDPEGNAFTTRDILHVCLESLADGSAWHFLVNHHPSKFGGEASSVGKRKVVMEAMAAACDSIFRTGGKNVVCMGDFNDVPDGSAFPAVKGVVDNLAEPLYRRGEGTIRFSGKWDLIDMFLVGPALSPFSGMEICRPPFLMVEDVSNSGTKPFRTYVGPRYAGGLSDHLPIILQIKIF